MAGALEFLGEHVEHEAPQELLGGKPGGTHPRRRGPENYKTNSVPCVPNANTERVPPGPPIS